MKWFPERHFGFAEADDGYRFFVHISQFSNGSVAFDKSGKQSIIKLGTKIIIGDVEPPQTSGQVPKALNVYFS